MVKAKQNGFTLMELMIVTIIVGVLAAIAYPSYRNYIVESRRADMMTKMQDIGKQIEARKLAAGRSAYANIRVSDLNGSYPQATGTPTYTVNIEGLDTGDWWIQAQPIAGTTQADDGVLILRKNGQKCRESVCGMGDEWKD